MSTTDPGPRGFTSRIVYIFLTGNLGPLLILLSIVAGAAAVIVTPREEEPQIVVPLADVMVSAPGCSAEEVERLVATRLEGLLFQIDGVEYVYSTSQPHGAVVTVRFRVGEDREDSLVKLQTKLAMSTDRIPPQVTSWVVKPVEIDDVPILAVALYSDVYSDFELRRIAEEIESHLQAVDNVSRTEIAGGRARKLRVMPDPRRLEAFDVSLAALTGALRAAEVGSPAGATPTGDALSLVEVHQPLATRQDVGDLVVAVHDGRPVYLRDVAEIQDGPAEADSYVRLGFGRAASDAPAGLGDPADDHAAVVLAVSKQKGTNSVWVAEETRARLAELGKELLPDGVEMRVIRDHGLTADHKVDELLEGLYVAIITVILLITVMLGWREGLIVASAVPITFALTLLVNLVAGYSINRVTLFALTLALGLVVDDPIVDVENIFRHLRRKDGRSPLQKVLDAVAEVRPPIILATLAVIVSFLPLFGITGMMGPYMAPMALNVPLAMLMSLIVAFTITPWLSLVVLGKPAASGDAAGDDDGSASIEASTVYRAYSAVLGPLLRSRVLRWAVLGLTLVLFGISMWLAACRAVPLKLLPYDNKGELQVVLDLPEGTTLERTEAVAAEMAARLRGLPEVVDVTSFAGVPSPMDFNGMVRHYYLRHEPYQAELRVNLVPKKQREHQSHHVALRVREALGGLATRHGVALKVVEFPPGPPVISTITAEIRGGLASSYEELCAGALAVAERLAREPGVVDVDTTVEAPQSRLVYEIDREKAALLGVTAEDAAFALRTALAGTAAAYLDVAREVNPLEVEVRLPRAMRSSVRALETLLVTGAGGTSIALGEVGTFVETTRDATRYRKNLEPVAYVFAEVAGRAPAEAILDVDADLVREGEEGGAPRPVPVEDRTFLAPGGGDPWRMPRGTSVDWSGEGEWKITLDVFRDLGIAFGVACFGIFVLLVYETRSYVMPLILMTSIPLTMLGIFPGFYLLNLLSGGTVAGAPDPVFFTATGMIGMIALAGIAVRNGILLIEFVHAAQAEGASVDAALLQSGAVRLRPIVLTAGTAMLAAVPITLDPIFSGLAWALIFGLFVSTAFTLVLVPMLYHMVYGRRGNDAPAHPVAASEPVGPEPGGGSGFEQRQGN